MNHLCVPDRSPKYYAPREHKGNKLYKATLCDFFRPVHKLTKTATAHRTWQNKLSYDQNNSSARVFWSNWNSGSKNLIHTATQGLFTWRWETPGKWGNPPSRGRKIKRVYMQSYNPGVLRWGFLRLLLRLKLRSLSRGVPSSHLEKDERLILGHICIYSWKRHPLCCAVSGYARNRWLNMFYGIVWETKYGWFTTLNIPKCEHFILLVCPLRFRVISAMRRLGNV